MKKYYFFKKKIKNICSNKNLNINIKNKSILNVNININNIK